MPRHHGVRYASVPPPRAPRRRAKPSRSRPGAPPRPGAARSSPCRPRLDAVAGACRRSGRCDLRRRQSTISPAVSAESMPASSIPSSLRPSHSGQSSPDQPHPPSGSRDPPPRARFHLRARSVASAPLVAPREQSGPRRPSGDPARRPEHHPSRHGHPLVLPCRPICCGTLRHRLPARSRHPSSRERATRGPLPSATPRQAPVRRPAGTVRRGRSSGPDQPCRSPAASSRSCHVRWARSPPRSPRSSLRKGPSGKSRPGPHLPSRRSSRNRARTLRHQRRRRPPLHWLRRNPRASRWPAGLAHFRLARLPLAHFRLARLGFVHRTLARRRRVRRSDLPSSATRLRQALDGPECRGRPPLLPDHKARRHLCWHRSSHPDPSRRAPRERSPRLPAPAPRPRRRVPVRGSARP